MNLFRRLKMYTVPENKVIKPMDIDLAQAEMELAAAEADLAEATREWERAKDRLESWQWENKVKVSHGGETFYRVPSNPILQGQINDRIAPKERAAERVTFWRVKVTQLR
jgi:hypothetical protein